MYLLLFVVRAETNHYFHYQLIFLQGLSALHMACLYGQPATIRLLVESGKEWINSSDLQGRRPIHMVLSSQSSPKTSLCLIYLLEQGADINV